MVKVPLGKLRCNPGGKEYLRNLITEEAQAYSAITVDQRDAALYPFGRYQTPEVEETPPITLPPSSGGLRDRVKVGVINTVSSGHWGVRRRCSEGYNKSYQSYLCSSTSGKSLLLNTICIRLCSFVHALKTGIVTPTTATWTMPTEVTVILFTHVPT